MDILLIEHYTTRKMSSCFTYQNTVNNRSKYNDNLNTLVVHFISLTINVYLQQIDSAIELLEKDEAVDISQLPPVPSLPETSAGN